MPIRQVYQAVNPRTGAPGRYYFADTRSCVPHQNIPGVKGSINPDFDISKYEVVPEPPKVAKPKVKAQLNFNANGDIEVYNKYTAREIIDAAAAMGYNISPKAAMAFFNSCPSLEEAETAIINLMEQPINAGKDTINWSAQRNKLMITRSKACSVVEEPEDPQE